MKEPDIQDGAASDDLSLGIVSPSPAKDTRGRGSTALLTDVCSLLRSSGTKPWVFYDAALGVLAIFLGFHLSPQFSFANKPLLHPVLIMVLFAVALVLGGTVGGVYERDAFGTGSTVVGRVVIAVALAWLCVLGASYVFMYRLIGRWVIGISSLVAVAGLAAPRVLVWVGARHAHRKVFAMVSEPCLADLKHLIGEGPRAEFELVDTREDAAVIVLDGTQPMPNDEAMQCLNAGVEVVDITAFAERHHRKELVGYLDASWLVSAQLYVCRPSLRAIKRLCDVVAAVLGLILTLPFWPIIALLIKSQGKGPVLYTQTRIGPFGKPFAICKFCTMTADSEESDKPVWAQQEDPRATRIGRILRRGRIDEIPQFWNILKGDMSLVGPRPERPEFVEALSRRTPCYGWRHLVRPGLTGWAQVNFRYGASEDEALEKLNYDLYYVKHFSFALDAYICLRTLAVFLRGSR